MITDVETDKNISPIATELFIRGRKLNISLVLILQSYFRVPKTISLKAKHYFIMILQNIAKENSKKQH